MGEHYKLDCSGCGRTISLPATDGVQACPLCSAVLILDWHRAARDYETTTLVQQ